MLFDALTAIASILILIIFFFTVSIVYFFQLLGLLFCIPLVWYFGSRLLGGIKKPERKIPYGIGAVIALVFILVMHVTAYVEVTLFVVITWCMGQLIIKEKEKKFIKKISNEIKTQFPLDI